MSTQTISPAKSQLFEFYYMATENQLPEMESYATIHAINKQSAISELQSIVREQISTGLRFFKIRVVNQLTF